MLRRVKKEVCGYLISWWFVKTFWMPIFGLHEWLKNRPRLPVLEASIIGNKVRRLASFSLDRFQMDPNCGDLNNRDEGKVCPEKYFWNLADYIECGLAALLDLGYHEALFLLNWIYPWLMFLFRMGNFENGKFRVENWSEKFMMSNQPSLSWVSSPKPSSSSRLISARCLKEYLTKNPK